MLQLSSRDANIMTRIRLDVILAIGFMETSFGLLLSGEDEGRHLS
jgi:hypothetical protein